MSGSPDKKDRDENESQNNNDLGEPNFRELLISDIEKAQEGHPFFLARRFLEGVLKMPPHESLRKIYANVILGDELQWESLIRQCRDEGVSRVLADMCIEWRAEKGDVDDVAKKLIDLEIYCRQADADGFSAEQARETLGVDKEEGAEEMEVGTEMIQGIEEVGNPNHKLSLSNLTPVRLFDINVIENPEIRNGVKSAAKNYDRRIKELMMCTKEPSFLPEKKIAINGKPVSIGSPIKVQNEIVMPLYIQGSSGVTRMVFAYYSESHATWRRLAGCLFESLYKDKNEYFQDIDWRIQKEMDKILNKKNPVGLPDHMVEGIGELAPCQKDGGEGALLMLTQEKQAQEVMRFKEQQVDFNKNGNKPFELLDFWFSGSENGVYGKFVTAIIQSKNKKYNYVIAITANGIFLKNIQCNEDDDIISGGSPETAVIPVKKQKWMLTPIIEYREQVKSIKEANLTKLNINQTFSGRRGGRARVNGMHSSSKSPFFQLQNGLAEVCAALQSGDERSVNNILSDILDGSSPLTLKKSPVGFKEKIGSKVEEEKMEKKEPIPTKVPKEKVTDKKAEEKILKTVEPISLQDWRTAYYAKKHGAKPEEPKKLKYTSSINCLYTPYTVKAGEKVRIEFLLSGIKLTIENGGMAIIGKVLPGAIIERMGPKAVCKVEEKFGDHDKNPAKIVNG
jgi:hypothetical protein